MILKNKREDGSYIQMRIHETATWTEAVEEFIHFLQGCGYILEGIDVAEYLMELYKFQRKDRLVKKPKKRK